MTISTHILAGVAIGGYTNNLGLTIIASLASHYLLDLIPHWDYLSEVIISRKDHKIKILIDLLIGLFLAVFLIYYLDHKLFIIIAIIFSILPDFLQGIHRFYHMKWYEPLSQFHYRIHRNLKNKYYKLNFWQGLPSLIIINLLIILALILKF